MTSDARASQAGGVRPLLLIADDYAMTQGVSRGIEDLIAAGRLSGTSAMTSMRHWPQHARRIAALRDRAAVGLHFNLTLGRPLTAMPRLAASGTLPSIGALTRAALLGAIDRDEIAAEMRAQLQAFAEHFGALPDFIDGHQHVHALPRIRDGVLAALCEAYGTRGAPGPRPLVRDPGDTMARIRAKGRSVAKAAVLAGLARWFGAAARRAGFATNDGFAGVSYFAPAATEADFAVLREANGAFPLAMCHPGYVDGELAALDPLTERRRRELDLLLADAGWRERILHPSRNADGRIDWAQLGAVTA